MWLLTLLLALMALRSNDEYLQPLSRFTSRYFDVILVSSRLWAEAGGLTFMALRILEKVHFVRRR